MLSYQHAYHAGNPADLHKHLVLAALLKMLTRKTRPITYMETHAGRGLYDLSSKEAQKTGEADEGVAKIALPECPLRVAVEAARSTYGDSAYPGSPKIAQTLLRPNDRIQLMELHPQEYAALKQSCDGDNTAIHHREGREGVLAVSPPKLRKGLVLIDPSYEVKSEYEETAKFAMKLISKWPEASILIWYPILPAGRHQQLADQIKLNFLRDEVFFDLKNGKGMKGSGLILINPPYGAEIVFADAHKHGAPILNKAT